MTCSRLPLILIACAAPAVVALSGCGSHTTTSSASYSSVTVTPGPSCPTAAPDGSTPAQWTLTGATGSLAVAGSTDTAAPLVKVEAPFSVNQTEVHTLTPGNGPVVAPTAQVSVCYLGINGRDGSVFDSSYQRGEPADFPLDGVVPGFQKAIAGQKVGSTVAVAMVSADGYPRGEPRAGIQAGDTLVFAIKILAAN